MQLIENFPKTTVSIRFFLIFIFHQLVIIFQKMDFVVFFYADDIVVYSKAKSFDKSIINLNSVLDV